MSARWVPLLAAARRLECAPVLHVSLFPVQPWLDVPGLGFAVLACADGDVAAAQNAAERVADNAWAVRDAFEPDLTSVEEAIRIGFSSPGLTVVGHGADAPRAVASGANTR